MAYDWSRPPIVPRRTDSSSYGSPPRGASSLTSLALPPLGPPPPLPYDDLTPRPYYGVSRSLPPLSSYADPYASSDSRSRSGSGSGRGLPAYSRGASPYDVATPRSPGARSYSADAPSAAGSSSRKLRPGQTNPNEHLLSAPVYPPVGLPCVATALAELTPQSDELQRSEPVHATGDQAARLRLAHVSSPCARCVRTAHRPADLSQNAGSTTSTPAWPVSSSAGASKRSRTPSSRRPAPAPRDGRLRPTRRPIPAPRARSCRRRRSSRCARRACRSPRRTRRTPGPRRPGAATPTAPRPGVDALGAPPAACVAAFL